MKKICKTLLLCVLSLVAVLCFVGCGKTNEADEKKTTYKLDKENNYYILTEYVGEDETLEIPSEYEGKPVGKIKKDAFEGNNTIKTLVIPQSVKVIDEGAFGKMKALENLTIPFVGNTPNADATLNDNNVTGTDKSVDNARTFGYVFSSASYDGGVKVTQYYNDATTTDEEGNVTPTGCFDCYIPQNLTTVTIAPLSAGYKLPAYAFHGNSIISKVVLTENVKEIGEYAFSDCQLLNTLVLPASVTDVHAYAFRGCLSLGNYNETTGRGFKFSANATLKNIGEYAFSAIKLTTIALPDTVENIGKFAFASMNDGTSILANGDSQLRNITLSKNLKVIGDGAFFMCEKLQTVSLHAESSDITLGTLAFNFCKNLSSFDSATANTINLQKVKSLGSYVFANIDNEITYNVSTALGDDVLANAFATTPFVKI